MGRYLQVIKQEAAKQFLPASLRSREPEQPQYYEPSPPQLHYEDDHQVVSGTRSELRGMLQEAAERARVEERARSEDRLDSIHREAADRLERLAKAAIDRPGQQGAIEIRYRGSAHDKAQRRFAELKFLAAALAVIAALIFIWWVKDGGLTQAGYAPSGWSQSAAPPQLQHKHYRHIEEYDDR
jgi:hypothetical protein